MNKILHAEGHMIQLFRKLDKISRLEGQLSSEWGKCHVKNALMLPEHSAELARYRNAVFIFALFILDICTWIRYMSGYKALNHVNWVIMAF